MKIDAMTGGAIAFAAFALYYVMKPKVAAVPANGSDIAYAMNTANRRDVGNNIWQNSLYWANLTPQQMNAFGSYQNDLRAQNIL